MRTLLLGIPLLKSVSRHPATGVNVQLGSIESVPILPNRLYNSTGLFDCVINDHKNGNVGLKIFTFRQSQTTWQDAYMFPYWRFTGLKYGWHVFWSIVTQCLNSGRLRTVKIILNCIILVTNWINRNISGGFTREFFL